MSIDSAMGYLEAARAHKAEIDRLRAELATKDARIAEFEKSIEELQAKLHCVCGSPVDHSPWEGHSPLSMYDYALDTARDDNEALRKELAEAKAALARTQDASLWWDQYNLEVRKHQDTKAALEAANARITSLMTGADRYWEERWREANARIAELELSRAEWRTLARTGPVFRAERAEAECKALKVKVDALHRLYNHALSMIEARAALNPSPAA